MVRIRVCGSDLNIEFDTVRGKRVHIHANVFASFFFFLCSCMLRLHLQAFMCESTYSGACCQFGFMEGIIDFHLVYETT